MTARGDGNIDGVYVGKGGIDAAAAAPPPCAATLLLSLQQLLLFVIVTRMVKMVPGIWHLVNIRYQYVMSGMKKVF